MKKINLLAIIGLVSLVFTSCGNEPVAPIPDSFPKKHLIEEFTSQACGNCPYGMDCVSAYIENDPNWIVVLHHDGYAKDHFTVPGSSTITTALNVNGAPSISIDRVKANYGAGKAVTFHPGYLEYTTKTQFGETTYASVVIDNTYEPESRKLTVRISGALTKTDYPDLKLTVLLKESGMVDYQSDYYNTYEGWEEFRHCNAVRAFMSGAKGDDVMVNDRRYSAAYTLTLDEKWVPENCMVVAALSEAFRPVVQAEQQPVVAGSKGGADIKHGGIKAVPVADYYPEPSATDGPADLSGNAVDTLTYSEAAYSTYTDYGFNFWQIMAYSQAQTITINKTKCLPFTYLFLFTQTSETAIPTGTYELTNTLQPGTAYAGFRDDTEHLIDGSRFMYSNKSYFSQGYLQPEAEWLIADGTLTITNEGWELVGHARNGADIHLVGSTPIQNKGKAPQNAPRKVKSALHAIEYCR